MNTVEKLHLAEFDILLIKHCLIYSTGHVLLHQLTVLSKNMRKGQNKYQYLFMEKYKVAVSRYTTKYNNKN